MTVDDECSVDDDCEAPLVCIKKLCVESDTEPTTQIIAQQLLSETCTRVDGISDLAQPVPTDAILIGAILPLTGELSVPGKHFDQVTQMAFEEINRVDGSMGRKFVKITCDSGTSPVVAKKSAEHLRDIGVQAVLGPFSSEIVLSVYNDVLEKAGIVVVSAGANAPIISNVSADGLIWSTSLPAAREARAMAEHILHSDYQRVAVIHRKDTWGSSMYDSFFSTYCDNAGVDCTNENTFMLRSYGTSDLTTSLSAVVTDLAAWQPDVTVAFTYVEDAITFVNIVGAAGIPLGDTLWNSTFASDLAFSLMNSSLHPLLCNIQATAQMVPDGSVHDSFLVRYRGQFTGSDPVPYTANFYDAAYMLAYAIAAASSDANPNPTGAQIAAAMNRLSSGEPIDAGSAQWNTGVQKLRSSASATIDYVGVSGDVNFKGGTGSIVSPVDMIRFNVGNMSLESMGTIYSASDVYSAPDYSSISDSVCTSSPQQ
ncbi:MAG: ABC transporter substrate-binding protein [Deltaproteobacteria bacterium]|nr:ABC transporter substrate-binding protein [Deltaproteobacteria bacterium]